MSIILPEGLLCDSDADNNITAINGLTNCRRLKYLNLEHNQIGRIEGLENLPLQFLSLVSSVDTCFAV